MTEQAPFRIGGYYRDGRGTLCHITEAAGKEDRVLVAMQHEDGDWGAGLAHFLSTGRFCATASNPDDLYHLVPGELDQQGNPLAAAADPSVQRDAQHVPVGTQESKRFDPFRGYYDAADASITSGTELPVIERSPPTPGAKPYPFQRFGFRGPY